MPRISQFLALMGSLVLFACGAPPPEEKKSGDPIPAGIAQVQTASENEVISAAGTVRLRRETELGFTTAGQVASVRYEEGDRVRRGAVLAALDTSTVAADLQAAKAERDRAEAQFERFEKLFEEGWVTKAQFEQSEAAARAARARVEAAGFASRTSHIHAPSNGIVLARNVDAGQIVPAGMTAIVLGETDKGFVLRVPMTDADASRVRVGMPAKVTISAVSSEPIDAVVSEMDGRADERTGTFEVSFLLPANSQFRSGQLGSVEMTLSRQANGLVAIPASAIFDLRSGEGLVYVVDDKNVTKIRNVVISKIDDSNVEIASGLVEGERIVVRGTEKIQEGDTIKPVRATK